jgi:cytochrome c oxidase subunit 3
LVAWWQLAQSDEFTLSLPAVGLFYLITGLHGLHILGGLVAYGRTLRKVLGGADAADIRTSVGLCTTYWHFMLGVWLALFGLVFTGNIAGSFLSYCGLI